MAAKDQAIRRTLLGPPPRSFIGFCGYRWKFARMGREDAIALVERLEAVDRPNRERLKELMSEIGWPGNREVGRDGSQMAWLLAQHSPTAFQRECLRHMIPAVREGNVPMEQVRMLHLMACGEAGSVAKSGSARVDSTRTLEELERCVAM